MAFSNSNILTFSHTQCVHPRPHLKQATGPDISLSALVSRMGHRRGLHETSTSVNDLDIQWQTKSLSHGAEKCRKLVFSKSSSQFGRSEERRVGKECRSW